MNHDETFHAGIISFLRLHYNMTRFVRSLIAAVLFSRNFILAFCTLSPYHLELPIHATPM